MELNKNYLYILIALLALLLIDQKCNGPVKPVLVETIKEQPASKEMKKIVPTAVTEMKIKVPNEPPIGKKSDITVVKKQDGEIVQVTKYKSDWGVFKRFGAFGGMSLLRPDGGLAISAVYYDRANLDMLLGVKGVGPGLSYQIFKNTKVGVDYNWQYETLTPLPGIYMSLGF